MRIPEFITSLIPGFGKDTLLEDIRLTRGEFEQLQDTYDFAAELMRSRKFKNKTVQDMVSQFKSAVTGSDNGNPIVHIAHHIPAIQKNLTVAEQLASANLSGQIVAAGVTYKQAVLVQYCDAMFLVAKYARKWLNLIFLLEASEYPECSLNTQDEITPAERAWLESTFGDFLIAYRAVTGDNGKVMAQLSQVPEASVMGSSSSNLASTVGAGKLDPLKTGFIATKANPIYFVRMVIAEWQVARYKSYKEDLKVIQLRIQLLKELQQNRPNAKLEKQIQSASSLAQSIEAKMADLEGK